MKRGTNTGLGGGIAVLLAIIVGLVMPFVTAAEVGNLYKAKGQPAPVVTGLWILLPLMGALNWCIKVNGAPNAYWRTDALIDERRTPRTDLGPGRTSCRRQREKSAYTVSYSSS